MDALENLRANMKRLRLQKNLTQQALAEVAGMEYKHLQKIESGRWAALQLRTVERIALALSVEAHQLIAPPKTGALKGRK